MTETRIPARYAVLAGSFASQPLAFAALLDALDRVGATLDLADVDVIRHAADVRLAHYFRPAVVARIQALQGPFDTLLVLRPSVLPATQRFSDRSTKFLFLGEFDGEMVLPTGDPEG